MEEEIKNNPSVFEELEYMEDAPQTPVMLNIKEHGRLCMTGRSGKEQAVIESFERLRRENPLHNYVILPFHARIETFSARTNQVIKWRKESGSSVWRT